MKISYRHDISMPNNIFTDLRRWIERGYLKSVQHQEFAYSYYWLTSYLWNYAKYPKGDFTQSALKEMLGYNRLEKRVNYIIKRNGLLDEMEYTETVSNYPIAYEVEDGRKQFVMLNDLSKERMIEVNSFGSSSYVVKKPLKSSTGFGSTSSHIARGEIFNKCMSDKELRCAGFYLCNIILYSLSKDVELSNDYLVDVTGWNLRRVTRVKQRLVEQGVINGVMSASAGKGERAIYEFLDRSGVKFTPEYVFDDLKGIGDNYLRYDFGVFHNNMDIAFLIEYDEEHHHKGFVVEDGEEWSGDYFHRIAIHDKMKNDYCKDNNIFLVRIPHWSYDYLDDILETVVINV